jgi:serine/threonine protein kinase
VAIKVMRPEVAANDGAADRFLREARSAAALQHDHIVTIYQFGQDRGVPLLAEGVFVGGEDGVGERADGVAGRGRPRDGAGVRGRLWGFSALRMVWGECPHWRAIWRTATLINGCPKKAKE